jgi:hypothetical protein
VGRRLSRFAYARRGVVSSANSIHRIGQGAGDNGAGDASGAQGAGDGAGDNGVRW